MRMAWRSAWVCGLVLCGAAARAESVDEGFRRPPDAAKPWTYWWWLDGNASKEGITRDLEEMKRQGIAGALVFDAGEGKGSPVGPVFMSPPWRELFAHAVREADRLGITLGANICSGWNAGGTWITPEHAAKRLVWSSVQVTAGSVGEITRDLPKPEVRENDYRDVAVLAYPGAGRASNNPPLKNWEVKAARVYLTQSSETLYEEHPDAPGDRDCESRAVVDLSARMDASGRLTWTAPEGNWTVLRIGYTLLGAKTSCPSPGSKGPEIDFLSAKALDAHWAETGAKMFDDAGLLAGKTLQYVHDDSYEVTNPFPEQLTWTPALRDEFRARRGYDMLPYLPVLAGKIVDDREVSNRFLRDYRRTIADLFADGHYRRLRQLAQQHGAGTHPESGGPFWPCIDALQNLGASDVPMGEFWKRVPEKPDGKIWWSDNYHICDTVRQAAAAAHIYGKPVCQAEAFTSMGPNWEEDFFDLKDIGDRAFCAGLTRTMLCFYVHQPRLDIKPGYQWEGAGTHFDRNVTWWDQSHAWLTYLSRCQYLLRQGHFAADFLYFYGEDAPNYVPAKTMMRPALPKGYDCDTCNADVLLNRTRAENGQVVLPDGMSYRYLVLPHHSQPAMSPQALAKVRELVEAGATIIGPRPSQSPGLTAYPQCDDEVRSLTNVLWGDAAAGSGTRRVGKGRVIWGRTLAEVVEADGLLMDSRYKGPPQDADLDFIHRRRDDVDIYFVSNQRNRPESADCMFRVSGKQPELWSAVTGEQRDATDWRVENGRTIVPLVFAPRESWFVVFRREARPPEHTAPNFPAIRPVHEIAGPWTVRFDVKWGGPESATFERLADWTQRPEEGIKYYSGKATYHRTFDLPESTRGNKRLYLDLGAVKNVAEVRLNGKDLGVVWTAPWRVEITSAVRTTGNELQIDIVNLWPNRLIGDAKLPSEKRLTETNVKKFKADSPLLPSGLLGPVTLQVGE